MYGLANQMVRCEIRKLFYILLVNVLMNILGKGNNKNFDKMQVKLFNSSFTHFHLNLGAGNSQKFFY